MKKFIKKIFCALIITGLVLPTGAYAQGGENGYAGGISSGEAPGKTSYEYQEVSFITGEPITFKGTLTIKKNLKNDVLVTTYRYTLANQDKSAYLTGRYPLKPKLQRRTTGSLWKILTWKTEHPRSSGSETSHIFWRIMISPVQN